MAGPVLPLVKAIAAGDVKLLMAVAAWSDASTAIEVGLLSLGIGALVGLVLMIRQKGPRESMKSLWEHLSSKAPRFSTRMPFAPGLLCAFAVFRIAELRQWHLF